MNCAAPGRHIKVFGKAIQCLGRIGEDVYFEADAGGLSIRTVNTSRSAYSSFSFHTSFFSRFTLRSQSTGELRCKVSSRSCLSIFKNLASLEKTTDLMTIELKYHEGELTFTLQQISGIKRQYNLAFQECEGLSAIFNKNTALVHLVAAHKLLGECVHHFLPNVMEVTLAVKPNFALVTNFVEEEESYSKNLQTQLKLMSSEFSQYNVAVERDVTFCLKEFRAILAFQDAVNLPINLYFDNPGSPIIMCVEDSLYECDFVLATLQDQNNTTSQYSQSIQHQPPSRLKPNSDHYASQVPTPRTPQTSQDNPFLNKKQAVTQPSPYCQSTEKEQKTTSNIILSDGDDDLMISSKDNNKIELLPAVNFSQTPPLSPSPIHDDSIIDDELLASLQCIPDAPDSPPHKRFRRLSSESDNDSVALASNLEPRDLSPVKYCDDSD